MGLRCKGCGSEAHIKNGFMRGKQRYRCKAWYLVRKAGRWWVQRGDAVGFLRRRGRDPLDACHRPHLIWMPYHLTA
jgi:hypothetical protein